MGGYENLPDPVPASDMVYENVARAILGGWSGIPDIIRGVTAEGTYSYTFSYTLPADEDPENIHIIGVVSDTNTGEIVNSNKVSLDQAVGVEEVQTLIDFNVFPNPSTEVFNIEMNLENAEQVDIYVTDFMGRKVMELVKGQEIDTYSTKINLKDVVYRTSRTVVDIIVKQADKQWKRFDMCDCDVACAYSSHVCLCVCPGRFTQHTKGAACT